MEEKRLYLNSEKEAFDGLSEGRQIVRNVYFSDDPRDFDWIRKNIPCQWACPARTNVPGYIRCIHEGRHGRSYELNRFSNVFPGTLGRICSRPCEAKCRHGEPGMGESVAICALKRAASDFKPRGHRIEEHLFADSGLRVAVVGAGPAGLAAAHDLARFGHRVVVYEAEREPGGMLRYGIPEFRLPRDVIDAEVGNILRLGVEVKYGVRLGQDMALEQLQAGHDAVLLATGCYRPRALGTPGEELDGVFSGLDFMVRSNMGERIPVGDRVVVIGGGFTAMDCARTARRLGARHVSIAIRTTEEDLTVTAEEVLDTKREKVAFKSLLTAVAIAGDNGRVSRIRFARNRFTGARRKVERIEGSEFYMDVDTVIAAIGQGPDLSPLGALNPGPAGGVGIVAHSYRASAEKVFACGDVVSGATTVIDAVAHARQAAWAVDEALTGRRRRKWVVRFEGATVTDRQRSWDFIPRVHVPSLPAEQRVQSAGAEVETGYDAAQASEESKRCYLCYLSYDIDIDHCIYCRWCIDVAPRDCIKLVRDVEMGPQGEQLRLIETTKWDEVAAVVIDNERCIRCGNCARVCPTKCIHVTKVEMIEQDVTQ